MEEKKQRRYFRLTKAERSSIERGLDSRESCRSMAASLGRSPSTVADEVRRNRTVSKGPGKGERVEGMPQDACPKLLSWPHVCNGCRFRRYRCARPWRCEYSAARAQTLAEAQLSEARRGVDCDEARFDWMMDRIRADVARGLSPAQIAQGRAAEFKVSASTIYRWIGAGYGGMCNADLRRKVGYRPRRKAAPARPTAHGSKRSYSAFSSLPDEERARACEMDTVIGSKPDSKCILTLYVRPCSFQFCLLLKDKTQGTVAEALDTLERVAGTSLFSRLFGLLLTDNGTEFSSPEALEKSACAAKTRSKVYYCDARQSQQKGRCERNHVELRKLLPKGHSIRFDELDARDMAELMSMLNSEPRRALLGATPFSMLKAAVPGSEALLDALGVREVPYSELDLTVNALNKARAERGLPPIQ